MKFTKLHRRNTVLNNEQGEGAPDDWCTEQVQGEPNIIIIIMLFRFKAAHGIRHELSQAEERGTDCTDYPSLTRSFHFWKGFPLLTF